MQSAKRALVILVPMLALGACTRLSDEDRALLTSASQNAQAASQQAAQAAAIAQQALDASRAAQASAAQAASHANDADEKAKSTSERSPPK